MFLRTTKTKKQRLPSRMLPVYGAPRRKTTNHFKFPVGTETRQPFYEHSDQFESPGEMDTDYQLDDDVFESDSPHFNSSSDEEESEQESEQESEDEEDETLSSSSVSDDYSTDDTASDITTQEFIKFKASQKRTLSTSSDEENIQNKVCKPSNSLHYSSESGSNIFRARRRPKKLDTSSSEDNCDDEVHIPDIQRNETYTKYKMTRTPPVSGNGPYNWPWL